jgi:type I restriction enzyme S subunit
MKEKLSLPKGWEIKTIGDVCVSASSNVSQNKLANDEGDYPIYGASGLIKKVSFYHQDKPYLSIVKDGSGVGRVTKMDAYTSVIGTLQYILPKENIDLDYLNYSLMSVDFKKYVAGAAIPHIYFKDYKNEPFLWMPLPEQQRIVSILDEAFAAIAKAKANAEQNLKNAKELFESYLQGVFENGKWETKKWGELCDFVRGPFGGSLKKNVFKESGYVVYEQKHAIHDHFNQLRYFIDEEKFNEMKRFEVFPGDIIMSCSGVTLGRVAVVPDGIPKGIINQALLKLTPKKNVNVHFIKHWLRSSIFQKIIFDYSGGAAIPNVPSAKILKDIKIPCPSLKEQERIVMEIEIVLNESKRLEGIYQRKIDDLEELKKSILQKAFAGELKTENKFEYVSR